MNFALALVNDETLEVTAVLRTDAPLDGCGLASPGHHVVHLGTFAHEQCPDERPWTEWLRESLMVQPDGTVHVDFGGPRLLDKACTRADIAQAHRGGRKIHAHVEAWLRTVLSRDACDAMGLRRAIPVSVLKALDGVRVARMQEIMKKDASGYSRREVLDRVAQRRIDARLNGVHQAHLERVNAERNAKHAAAQAQKAVGELAARVERELNVKSPPPRDVPYITVIQEAIAKAKETD